MRPLNESKVLILHPFLNYYGGAEYLLGVVANEIVPQADICVFSYDKSVLNEIGLKEERVKSLLGKGFLGKLYRQLTPFYPALIDTLQVENYDLVLSFSYGYTHGVVTSHTQPHISYIQTPMRLLWLKESEHYWYNKVPLVKQIYQSILSSQRMWDRQAAMRPDYLLTNSKEVKNRVKTFWDRESKVIYPPVDVDFYLPPKSIKKEDYFVTHSRLVRYKRIDILIEGCMKANKKLVVIGDGPDYKRLKKVAGRNTNIEFTGYATQEQKRDLLQKAKGFLFASFEDFGIAPVEALAAGTPVYAYGKGGALETISPDTGMFFKEQTVESFSAGLKEFETFTGHVNREVLRRQAEKFSKSKFISEYSRYIDSAREDFVTNGPPVFG